MTEANPEGLASHLTAATAPVYDKAKLPAHKRAGAPFSGDGGEKDSLVYAGGTDASKKFEIRRGAG